MPPRGTGPCSSSCSTSLCLRASLAAAAAADVGQPLRVTVARPEEPGPKVQCLLPCLKVAVMAPGLAAGQQVALVSPVSCVSRQIRAASTPHAGERITGNNTPHLHQQTPPTSAAPQQDRTAHRNTVCGTRHSLAGACHSCGRSPAAHSGTRVGSQVHVQHAKQVSPLHRGRHLSVVQATPAGCRELHTETQGDQCQPCTDAAEYFTEVGMDSINQPPAFSHQLPAQSMLGIPGPQHGHAAHACELPGSKHHCISTWQTTAQQQ